MTRFERGNFFKRDLVVAVNSDLLLKLAEVLHQVVGEGIVIVDHQEHIASILLIYMDTDPDNPT